MPNTELNLVYKWVRIALIFLCVVLGVGALVGLKALRQAPVAYNSITVSGQGEATGTPDVGTFSFSISADSKVVSDAQNAVNKKASAVIMALKNLGIEERDIKTSDYSVYPKYTYEEKPSLIFSPARQVQDGYTASESVVVKVRKTELTGQAIQAAGDNGATNISGLSFVFDDPNKLVNDARSKAIADAKAKAELLAKDLGVRLVRVVSYTEGGNGGSPLPYVAAEARMGPVIPTGENKVSARVDLTYEIR